MSLAKSINYANCVTLMRILLLPVYFLFLFWALLGKDTRSLLIPLLLYIILGLADLLDGTLARKFKQTTRRGEMMDTLADYFLLSVSYALFIFVNIAPFWMLLIIIGKFFLFLAPSVIVKPKKSSALFHDWPGRIGAVLFFLSVGVVLLYMLINPEPIIYKTLINSIFLFLLVWSILASFYRVKTWKRLASG